MRSFLTPPTGISTFLRPHRVVAAILGSAGIAHVVSPNPFDSLVPSWMPGDPRMVTYISGAFECASAVLIAVPHTRRFGGMLALATFAAVYPANIWAALDGGMKDAPPPFNSPAAAWFRLPLQFPLFWLAWQIVRKPIRLTTGGGNGSVAR
jgi:uncharacterized membrane protein